MTSNLASQTSATPEAVAPLLEVRNLKKEVLLQVSHF